MRRTRVVVVAAALVMVSALPAAAQLSYSLTDLGLLTGSNADPGGVARDGQVAITSAPAGRLRSSMWTWSSTTDLGTLGGSDTQAHGIGLNTALGVPQIVGNSLTASGSSRAFLWTQGGTNGVVGNRQMRDLGTLPGGDYSDAYAVNASGRVTGFSANAAGTDRAFLWSSGTMTDLGALVQSGISKTWSYGYSINTTGQVVGVAYDASFVNSFAWFYTGTTVKGLGHLGGGNAEAVGINDSGQIVGFSTTSAGRDHAFITTGSTSMRDLGTLGGPDSFATAINNSGQVVGGSFIDPLGEVYRAFVTVSGTMRNLNSFVDSSGEGWVLEEATGINSTGQIVGVATASGTSRAFLLTPVANVVNWSTSGTVAGGTGIWSGTSTTWLSGTGRRAWTSWSHGVFSGPSSTVTVSGSIDAAEGLEFRSVLTTLTGGTLVLRSGTYGNPPTISVSSTATAAVATTLAGTSGLIKAGPGMLVLRGTTTLSGPVTVQSGTLRLASTTALASGSVATGYDGTLKVSSLLQLSLARLDLSAGGRLDVNDGTLTVASGLTPATTVAAILEGVGDGSWNGTTGITSTAVAAAVAAGESRAIGWSDNGGGSITVAYSAPGDTNIDGTVDVLDASNFVAGGKYNVPEPASWLDGDFTYDGFVDVLDAADFASSGLYNAGPYITFAASPVAAVPEPTAGVGGEDA